MTMKIGIDRFRSLYLAVGAACRAKRASRQICSERRRKNNEAEDLFSSLVSSSSVYTSGSSEVFGKERSLEELESELTPSGTQKADKEGPLLPPGIEQEDDEVGQEGFPIGVCSVCRKTENENTIVPCTSCFKPVCRRCRTEGSCDNCRDDGEKEQDQLEAEEEAEEEA